MSIRKTSVAIDRVLLGAAKKILRTSTTRETIERALVEVVRSRARREEAEALSTMKGMDLANSKVMAKAWPK